MALKSFLSPSTCCRSTRLTVAVGVLLDARDLELGALGERDSVEHCFARDLDDAALFEAQRLGARDAAR